MDRIEFTCGDCSFWDWYYCEYNSRDDDGLINAQWGCCTQKNGIEYPKGESACSEFEQGSAWQRGWNAAKDSYLKIAPRHQRHKELRTVIKMILCNEFCGIGEELIDNIEGDILKALGMEMRNERD